VQKSKAHAGRRQQRLCVAVLLLHTRYENLSLSWQSLCEHNNLAERELRPLVIARKISFGSQSEAGARTREILMAVLHTLKKRTSDMTTAFKSALDEIAEQGDIDPHKAIFSFESS